MASPVAARLATFALLGSTSAPMPVADRATTPAAAATRVSLSPSGAPPSAQLPRRSRNSLLALPRRSSFALDLAVGASAGGLNSAAGISPN